MIHLILVMNDDSALRRTMGSQSTWMVRGWWCSQLPLIGLWTIHLLSRYRSRRRSSFLFNCTSDHPGTPSDGFFDAVILPPCHVHIWILKTFSEGKTSYSVEGLKRPVVSIHPHQLLASLHTYSLFFWLWKCTFIWKLVTIRS